MKGTGGRGTGTWGQKLAGESKEEGAPQEKIGGDGGQSENQWEQHSSGTNKPVSLMTKAGSAAASQEEAFLIGGEERMGELREGDGGRRLVCVRRLRMCSQHCSLGRSVCGRKEAVSSIRLLSPARGNEWAQLALKQQLGKGA